MNPEPGLQSGPGSPADANEKDPILIGTKFSAPMGDLGRSKTQCPDARLLGMLGVPEPRRCACAFLVPCVGFDDFRCRCLSGFINRTPNHGVRLIKPDNVCYICYTNLIIYGTEFTASLMRGGRRESAQRIRYKIVTGRRGVDFRARIQQYSNTDY